MDEDARNRLVAAATAAKERAYAPYSRFKVGAAVLGASGQVYTGCNIENAAFPATLCAERVAIGKAISEGETRLVAIAVVSDADEPCPPCGMCRQVMAEFGQDMIVFMKGRSSLLTETVRGLLPFGFGCEYLGNR